MELSKIATINRALGERFNSIDSFIEYIDVSYKASPKLLPVYEKRLKTELGHIHDYLLGIFEGKITKDTLREMLSRINILVKNVNSIRINISNSLRDYEMHQGIPERFFEAEMNKDINSGKSKSLVYSKYSRLLNNELVRFDVYDSYIQKSFTILQDVFRQLLNQFPQYAKSIKSHSRKTAVNRTEGITESFNLVLSGVERVRKIESLFQYLKQEKLIETKTSCKNFSNLFLGVPIRKKVNWTGKTNHLGYFIKQLKEIEILSGIDEKRTWTIAKACFLINGKLINIDNLKTNCNPTDKEVIRSAIALLK